MYSQWTVDCTAALRASHLRSFVLEGDDTALNHLVVEIVALAGALADAGEDGVTSVSLGDVVDQFHDQDGLADSGSAEQTNLTSLGVGSEQIYDLDTSDENLLFDAHVLELWSLSVDSLPLVSGNWTPLINGLTNDIDNSAQSFWSYWDHDGTASVNTGFTTYKTFCTIHSNCSHNIFT